MERFSLLDSLWVSWQQWFAEVEETHTSLGVLSFFRSPQPSRSWITAAGAILDGASLRQSALDLPFDPEAGLCVRGGFVALRAIGAYFDIPFDPDRDLRRPDQHLQGRVPGRVRPARRRGAAGARRPRGRLEAIPGLARELRQRARRARGLPHGAVRAVVVGPLAGVPAPAVAPQAPAPCSSASVRRSRSRASRRSCRGA